MVDYLSDDHVEKLIHQLRAPNCELQLRGREGLHALKAALAQPQQTFDGCDLYVSLEDKAAILLYCLAKSHPFVDGNKRFAVAATLAFLDINGYMIDAPQSEIAQFMDWVCSSPEMRSPQIVWWLRQRIAPLS